MTMDNATYRSCDGQAGVALTPMATFSGLRRLPWVALSHNSLFPGLVIGPEAVTIRVLRRHVLAYEDLARIYLGQGLGYRLTFEPKRGWRDFTASFVGRDMAAATITALMDCGAPVDPLARDLIGESFPVA